MNPLLKQEIDIDFSSMEIIVNDVEELINSVGSNEPSNIQKTALGGFAAQFYNGVENILKRIHKYYKIDLPSGDNWHLELLERYSEKSNFEISIKLTSGLIEKLKDYRRFRHYFFHGYSHNLNWDILKDGVSDIRIVFEQLSEEILK